MTGSRSTGPERRRPSVTTGRGWTRRRLFGTIGVGGVTAVAGCSGRDGTDAGTDADPDVAVGPGGRLVFEPETITIGVGDTVTWYFDGPGHNVSVQPEDSDVVSLPDGVEPFATVDTDQSPYTLVPDGETFDHRFTVTGTYVYSCRPHEGAGMTGRIEVEA